MYLNLITAVGASHSEQDINSYKGSVIKKKKKIVPCSDKKKSSRFLICQL